ncbi:MAG TPA: ubiquinol-cytochrome c reductase iron-sulfur subunit [Acetobacteraceae bacterium]|nr:ubiquinol-cytochrome c reductase iron-sulfur subunit [Acetobacteraceae bacterium]
MALNAGIERESGAAPEAAHGEPRRDFLKILIGSTMAVGAAAVAWPFLDYLGSDADARAQGVVDVDVSPIAANSGITVRWRGKPVFVRRLTPKQLAAVQATPMKDLIDPASFASRVSPGGESWVVLVGLCPHRGCIPLGNKPSDPRGPYDGWLCPCHGAAFDAVGRVRRGPAERNLPVPPYRFASPTMIRIG